MSWLLPSALAIAGVAMLAAIALHFIARSRPLAEALPTARFVPHRPVHARARSIALSDVVLLLVRIATVLALGAAVAGPVFAVAHGRVARVIVVDRSRDVADLGEARDSVRRLRRDGDVLVAFDSVAMRLPSAFALDSLTNSEVRGSLSAALAMSLRVAAELSRRGDSLELIVVSPLAVEEIDQATPAIRAEWPGRIRVVPVRAVASDERNPRVESATRQDDIVIAGLSLSGVFRDNANVRIVRGRPTTADTVWARDGGDVLVVWPTNDSAAMWPPRATIDAIGGVTSNSGTLIGRFPRAWTLSGRAIARWADGEAAAVEHVIGRGCIRDVGIIFDPASDITLRAPFRQFAAALLEPCGGNRRTARVDSALLASIAGEARATRFSPVKGVGDRSSESSTWSPWLLALGAVLLVVEMAVRKAGGRSA